MAVATNLKDFVELTANCIVSGRSDIMAPSEQEVKERMCFQTKTFTLQHCGVKEGSVKPPDNFTLRRIQTKNDANTHNVGANFSPPPDNRKDLFVWGGCQDTSISVSTPSSRCEL